MMLGHPEDITTFWWDSNHHQMIGVYGIGFPTLVRLVIGIKRRSGPVNWSMIHVHYSWHRFIGWCFAMTLRYHAQLVALPGKIVTIGSRRPMEIIDLTPPNRYEYVWVWNRRLKPPVLHQNVGKHKTWSPAHETRQRETRGTVSTWCGQAWRAKCAESLDGRWPSGPTMKFEDCVTIWFGLIIGRIGSRPHWVTMISFLLPENPSLSNPNFKQDEPSQIIH